MVNIYSSNVAIPKTSVFYNSENLYNEIATVRIESAAKAADVLVDNVKIESYYSSYVAATIMSQVNSEKDIAQSLTFESSNSGNLPSAITTNLTSSGAAVRIENTVNGGTDKYSNVLVFDTTTGSNDRVAFNTSKDMTGYSCYTFSADIRLDADSRSESMYWIMFSQKNDSNRVYMIGIGGNSKSDEILLRDSSNTSTANANINKADSGAAFGEWFNLKVELYPGDKDTVKFVVYVDGEKVMESSNFYLSHEVGSQPQSSILEYVSFYSLGDTTATLSFDNVRIIGTK